MIPWNKLQLQESGGMTFWAKEGANVWSRNIIDLVNYIKQLEGKKEGIMKIVFSADDFD